MKRRTLLKLPIINSLLLNGCGLGSKGEVDAASFEAFIISDAHMGWTKKSQPSVEQQQAAISKIHRRFPDLNLWIDTGDAHHTGLVGDSLNKARQEWKDVIANNSNGAPLFYVPGNHELGGSELGDPEKLACDLGGIPLRPYYSFEMSNIRFISIPQLIKVNQVSQETLNWLDLELTMAARQSVIILSHNAIQNTTYHGDNTVYRAVANSKETLAVLNKHNNVLAWMHGHNHQFEIVDKHDRFYVSNGRIGGFIPSKKWGDFGQGHLGGVYLKITAGGIEIKAYSATIDDFFEAEGKSHLSAKRKVATSLNTQTPSKVQIGHGLSQTESKYKVNNHFVGSNCTTALASSNVGIFLNDNPNLTSDTDLVYEGKAVKNLLGSFYRSRQDSSYPIEVRDNRIFFTPGAEKLYFPRPSTGLSKENKIRYRKLIRGHYYQAVPGRTYQFEILTPENNVKLGGLKVACINSDRSVWEKYLGLNDKNQWRFTLPDKNPETGAEPVSFYLILDKDTATPVELQKIKLNVLEDKKAENKRIKTQGLDGDQKTASMDALVRLGQPLINQVTLEGASDQLFTWWLQTTGVEWQIRNGKIKSYHRGVWEVEVDDEVNPVILAPLFKAKQPFIHAIQPTTDKKVYIKLEGSYPKLVGNSKGLKVVHHRPGTTFKMPDWLI